MLIPLNSRLEINNLLYLCKRLHILKHRTTIQDIADALQITTSTVSRALNNHPAISVSTKRRVIEMAEKLNYQPNRIAAALRSGRSNIIGAVIPFVDRAFFGSIIRGIEDEIADKGYGLIICQAYDHLDLEKRAINTLLKSRVDGILASVAANSKNIKYYQNIQKAGTPLLFFDRIIEQIETSVVVLDDFNAGYQATVHLIDQGYQCIAHFAGDQDSNIYRERKKGYEKALEDYDMARNSSWIAECRSSIELGKKQMERLWSQKNRPDALFSSSDYAALGAMQYLLRHGVSIPRDFGIIGFANEPFTSYVYPSLSTVNQFPEEMGRIAARTLLNEVQQVDGFRLHKSVIPPEIIVRESSLRQQ